MVLEILSWKFKSQSAGRRGSRLSWPECWSRGGREHTGSDSPEDMFAALGSQFSSDAISATEFMDSCKRLGLHDVMTHHQIIPHMATIKSSQKLPILNRATNSPNSKYWIAPKTTKNSCRWIRINLAWECKELPRVIINVEQITMNCCELPYLTCKQLGLDDLMAHPLVIFSLLDVGQSGRISTQELEVLAAFKATSARNRLSACKSFLIDSFGSIESAFRNLFEDRSELSRIAEELWYAHALPKPRKPTLVVA